MDENEQEIEESDKKIIMEKLVATQGTGAAGGNCKPLTTFVQTDTNTFREVVQRLTGPSDQINNNNSNGVHTSQDHHQHHHVGPGNPKTMMMMSNAKRSTSKLHERRQYMRPKLEIVKPSLQYFKAAEQQQSYSPPKAPNSGAGSLLPSPVGTPSSIFSKLSILEEENKVGGPTAVLNSQEEEKAIKERRFYLHPSPRGTQRDNNVQVPELLPLFPLQSPTANASDQKG